MGYSQNKDVRNYGFREISLCVQNALCHDIYNVYDILMLLDVIKFRNWLLLAASNT